MDYPQLKSSALSLFDIVQRWNFTVTAKKKFPWIKILFSYLKLVEKKPRPGGRKDAMSQVQPASSTLLDQIIIA